MKNSILYITFALLLSSCAWDNGISQEYRMVDIVNQENVTIGKWVFIDDYTILTNTHIISHLAGQKVHLWNRQYRNIESLHLFPWKDITELHMKDQMSLIGPLSFDTVKKNDLLYALVERSGGVIRLEGKVTATDVRYLGYDSSLSGKVFTWAIESNIVLSPWESGTPIWKNSWEIVGIVSAVDSVNKKSYIVQ